MSRGEEEGRRNEKYRYPVKDGSKKESEGRDQRLEGGHWGKKKAKEEKEERTMKKKE